MKNSIIFPRYKNIDFFRIVWYNGSMNCIFDREKLGGVLSDFYSSTGIAIALYDARQEVVALSPVYSECCSYIRASGRCAGNCDRSNTEHMREVEEARVIKRYTCHAGMMETILPIIYEDILIAYLQIGQFRDAEAVYSAPDRLIATAEKYGLDRDVLLTLYEKLPTVSEDKLTAVCNILDIIIKSFWRDGLITYKRSMLSVRMEKYIEENLGEEIYIEELCDRFLLSKNALYQLFRNEFGTTVNGFITAKRIRAAQRYLTEEKALNVTQISSLCGFPDYNYFIRVFKKETGVTPLGFRKAAKK